MRYPCLVKKNFCKTDITCSFKREGLNEYGEPLKAVEYSGKCNYQDKARTVLTAETLSKEHLGNIGDGNYYYKTATVDVIQR